MREPISLKSEREILITVIKDLVNIKHRLSDLIDDKSEVAQLYSSELLDADMNISNLCNSIGGMVGYTIYSDLCEGLEI